MVRMGRLDGSERASLTSGSGLTGVEGEGDGLEEALKGPTAGQADADAAGSRRMRAQVWNCWVRRVSICAKRKG